MYDFVWVLKSNTSAKFYQNCYSNFVIFSYGSYFELSEQLRQNFLNMAKIYPYTKFYYDHTTCLAVHCIYDIHILSKLLFWTRGGGGGGISKWIYPQKFWLWFLTTHITLTISTLRGIKIDSCTVKVILYNTKENFMNILFSIFSFISFTDCLFVDYTLWEMEDNVHLLVYCHPELFLMTICRFIDKNLNYKLLNNYWKHRHTTDGIVQ